MKKLTIENLVPLNIRQRSANSITLNSQGLYIPLEAANTYGLTSWNYVVCFHYDVNSFGVVGYPTINDVPHSLRKDMVTLQPVYAKGTKQNPYAYRIVSKTLVNKYGTTNKPEVEVVDVAGVSGLLISVTKRNDQAA